MGSHPERREGGREVLPNPSNNAGKEEEEEEVVVGGGEGPFTYEQKAEWTLRQCLSHACAPFHLCIPLQAVTH